MILFLFLLCVQGVFSINPVIINTTAGLIDINQINNTILTSKFFDSKLSEWDLDGNLLKTIDVGCNISQIIFNNKYKYTFIVCGDLNTIKIFNGTILIKTIPIIFNRWVGEILLDEFHDYIITYCPFGFTTNTTIFYMDFSGNIVNKYTLNYTLNNFWINPKTHFLIASNYRWNITSELYVFTLYVNGLINTVNIKHCNYPAGLIMDMHENFIMYCDNNLNMYNNYGEFIKVLTTNTNSFWSLVLYEKYNYIGFMTDLDSEYCCKFNVSLINEKSVVFTVPYAHNVMFGWRPILKIFQNIGVIVAVWKDVRIWNNVIY